MKRLQESRLNKVREIQEVNSDFPRFPPPTPPPPLPSPFFRSSQQYTVEAFSKRPSCTGTVDSDSILRTTSWSIRKMSARGEVNR